MFGAPPAPPPEPGAEPHPGERGAARDVGTEKAENFVTAFIQSIAQERGRNVEWVAEAVRESKAITQREALQKHVIDLAADDLEELLARVHGRKVKLGRDVVVLDTRDATVRRVPMALVHRFFDVISDPQIALLLILAGLLGLYVEFTQPGLIFPGVAGAAALLLAGLALQVIPFNWIGLLLIVAGVALLVAELFVTSFGLLFAAGLTCLAFGAYVLFDVPSESDLRVPFWEVIFPAVAAVAIFGGIVVIGISRTMLRPQVVGAEGLVGALAVADSDIAPEGRVFLHGELWTARSTQPIAKGEPVEITRVSDLVVHVKRHAGEEET
jgi:membrane-bound serine protease (ClpP class)